MRLPSGAITTTDGPSDKAATRFLHRRQHAQDVQWRPAALQVQAADLAVGAAKEQVECLLHGQQGPWSVDRLLFDAFWISDDG